MKWSIHELQKQNEEYVTIDETIRLDSLVQRVDTIRAISDVRLHGTCHVQENEMTFQLTVEGTATVPCARTWKDAYWNFSLDLFEQFSWDEQVLATNELVHRVERNTIDLRPVLEEIVLVSLPLQVYSEEAADLSYVEGKGWTYMTDDRYEAEREEEEPKVDPRLAGLAKLFQSDSDSE